MKHQNFLPIELKTFISFNMKLCLKVVTLFIVGLYCPLFVYGSQFVYGVQDDLESKIIRRTQKINNADQNLVKVKFQYVQSVSEFMPSYIAAYNSDNFVAPYLSGALSDEIEIPVGTYDFIVVFDHQNSNYTFGKEGTNIIIKENVKVDGDMSVDFDATEATNTIKMVAYKTNGELCKVPTCKYTDENWTKTVIEPGNIAETYVFKSVLHKKYGKIYNLSTNGGSSNFIPGEISSKQHNSDDYLAFHVNDVSDNYMFQQLRFMPTDESDTKSYVVTLRQLGSKSGEVSNNVSDYFSINENFDGSVNASSQPRYPYSVSFGMVEDDTSPYEVGFSWANANIINLDYCPAELYDGFDDFKCQIVFSKVETCANDGMEYAINTAPVRITDSENILYIPVNPYESYRVNSNGQSIVSPGPTDLCYRPSEKIINNGGSVPVAVFSYMEQASPYAPGAVLPVMNVEYLGRLGDKRNMDKALMEKCVKYNGEVVLDNNGGSLSDFGYSWSRPAGLFEIETSCSNTQIDDIVGKNTMFVSFDQRKEDKFAPVVQMLQFRDADNNVTDRFATAEDGSYIIAGGDFVQKTSDVVGSYGETIYYFDLAEVPQILVEYAKHGTDDYKSMDVELDKDNTYLPGFGNIWKGSLASVDVTGWVDMRISLTDDAGNYQVQTIEPAFFIERATGINEIQNDKISMHQEGNLLKFEKPVNDKIEIYSINGVKVLQTTDNVINLDRLPQGVNIIKCTSEFSCKVVK